MIKNLKQDNGNVKRRKLIDSTYAMIEHYQCAEIKSKSPSVPPVRNVILFNKLKIIKNMVLMLFQY